MADSTAPTINAVDAGQWLDLLCQAAEVVVQRQYATQNVLQRRVRVGFATAGRLLALLEEAGIIGASTAAGVSRDVLVTPAQLPAVLQSLRAKAADVRAAKERADSEVTHLTTLQFAWGGLADSTPADDLIHLVSQTHKGNGPVLCGIDRFAPGAPGWSIGGGVDGPGMVHTPCSGCVAVARRDFPDLPIVGMHAGPIAESLGTASHRHLPRVEASHG